MNKAMLTGRLTKDPVVRYSQGENSLCIANFTLAVDRRWSKNQEANGPTADFINCVAFGKTGEFVEKYAKKGMKFDVVGRIQTRNYQNKEGQTVYVTEVVIEDMEFGESKKSQGGGSASDYSGSSNGASAQYDAPQGDTPQPADDGFMNVPDEIDDELPFN